MILTAATPVYAVIGDPISRSLSPTIHNYWMEQLDLEGVYIGLNLKGDCATEDIKALRRAGFAGLNVTLPHKVSALNAASVSTKECDLIGASNTLAPIESGWEAHNTDAAGFIAALSSANSGQSLKGRKILIIGAGGAARAVTHALHLEGALLKIANRTVSRAEELSASLAPSAQPISLDDLFQAIDEVDAVVNASSMGHGGQGLELPKGEDRLFYDLSYGHAADNVLKAANAQGWRTEDGLGMLVEQARLAFRIWHGVDPDSTSAIDLCREKLKEMK